MVYVRLKITDKNYDASIQGNKKHPLHGSHAIYSDVQTPNNGKTSLAIDLHRCTHVYVPQGKDGGYQDVVRDTQEMNPGGDLGKGKELIGQFLTKNPVRAEKLQGLNQDVGNAIADSFMNNFKFNFGSSVEPLIGDKIATQNITKVSENQFRFDVEQIIYFLPPNMEREHGKYRDLDGRWKDFDGNVQLAVLKADGTIEVTAKTTEKEIVKFSCLPIAKMNSSASIKFDKDNNSTVVVDVGVATYSEKIEYVGPKTGRGVVSVDEQVQDKTLSSLASFSGRTSGEINKEIDLMLSLLRQVSTDIKFKQRLEEYKGSPEKDVLVEMELYEKFFSKMKKHYSGMKGSISDTEKQVLRGVPGSKVKVIGAMQFAILQAYHPDKTFQLKKKSAKTIRKIKENMSESLSFLRKKDKSAASNSGEKHPSPKKGGSFKG